ncbi:hypothetical protein E2C01_027406 [Portunus trituberculatus]|uniref:Secreted protein n=1 Tax=Portunus trituberculatus TaxID=210409 RepID=A0A5B7ENN7_PORTR|nr:hypothetical protein [Portunus trituberculatus]
MGLQYLLVPLLHHFLPASSSSSSCSSSSSSTSSSSSSSCFDNRGKSDVPNLITSSLRHRAPACNTDRSALSPHHCSRRGTIRLRVESPLVLNPPGLWFDTESESLPAGVRGFGELCVRPTDSQ